MRRFIHFTFALFAFATTQAQDSTAVKGSGKNKIVLVIGASRSLMTYESIPYFADSAGKVGNSTMHDSFGLSVGTGILTSINDKWTFRALIEGHMMPATIKFDTEVNHQTSAEVFPFSAEIPISVSYNITRGEKPISIIAGVRPAFCPETFADPKPKFQSFDFGADFGAGIPLKLKKSQGRLEMFYSHGFLDLAGDDDSDYRGRSVKHIGRSFVGLRFFIY